MTERAIGRSVKSERRIVIQDGISISVIQRSERYGVVPFKISTPHDKNYLSAIFQHQNREFRIDNIKCRQQREDIGIALLHAALSEAQKIKAAKITATIQSREALNAAQGVFGEGAIRWDTTAAFLDYSLVNRFSVKHGKASSFDLVTEIKVKGDLL